MVSKGWLLGPVLKENMIAKAGNEILPLYANSLSVFKCLENPILFFETLKLLKVPSHKLIYRRILFEDLGSDWILKDLGSSGGRGKKTIWKKIKSSEYFQKQFQEWQ